MESIEATLERSRKISEQYKEFLKNKAKFDQDAEETNKRIAATLSTIGETLVDIKQTQNKMDEFQRSFSQAIDALAERAQGMKAEVHDENGQLLKAVTGTIQTVAATVRKSQKIFILTGAGMSAASGIRTFRDKGGYWDTNNTEQEDPQKILTYSYFEQHPQKCWKWLRDFYQVKLKAKPNAGHLQLAKLISKLLAEGKQVTLVTQNIDNLHQEAVEEIRLAEKMANMHIKKDNKKEPKKNDDKSDKWERYNYFEIHGNINYLRCAQCTETEKKLIVEPTDFKAKEKEAEYTPKVCSKCKGPLRPHIMFFDEVYSEAINRADTINDKMTSHEILIIIGTKLQTGMANNITRKFASTLREIFEFNVAPEVEYGKVKRLYGKSEQTLLQLNTLYKAS